MAPRPPHILIVKLSSLGDVIHTLPALTTIRRHQPAARIAWLTQPPSRELLESHGALDDLILWDRKGWSDRLRGGRWISWSTHALNFLRRLRSVHYDLVIDFQGLAKSAMLVALTRAHRKAGYGPGLPRKEGAWLPLNVRVPAPNPNDHAIDRNLQLIEFLGFSRLPLRYDLPISAEDADAADRALREAGLNPDRPFVAINPKTRWHTKDWDPAFFARTLALLRARGIPAVLTGAPADRSAIDEIATAAAAPAPRVDGRTSLLQLGAIYRRARAVLSLDTGTMHLAAAVGAPVVALFGPTAPWRTGPYGPQHVVLRTELHCSPCWRRTCLTTEYEKRACMLRLKPEAVADAICRVLDRAPDAMSLRG